MIKMKIYNIIGCILLLFLILSPILLARPSQSVQLGQVEEQKTLPPRNLQNVTIQIYGKLYSIEVIIYNPNEHSIDIDICLNVSRFFGGRNMEYYAFLQPGEMIKATFRVGVVASGYIKIICGGETIQSYRFYKYGPILQLFPWNW